MGVNGWGGSVVWVMNVWWVVQNTSKGCIFIWYNSYVHILIHYEKIDFWKFREFAILSYFHCILKLFSLCKIRLKLRSFMFRLFGWEYWRVKPTLSKCHFGPKWPSGNIGSTPQHSHQNNWKVKDRRFSLILHQENSFKIQWK